jgi:hypothetical protein
MADINLNAAMDIEGMDEDVFSDMRSRREARLSASNPVTSQGKSILKQKVNLNSIRSKLEKVLRLFSNMTEDPTPAPGVHRFSIENKAGSLKDLRSMLHEVKRQEDYLSVAESHSVEIADKVEAIEGGGKIEPARQKILGDLLKENKYLSIETGYRGGANQQRYSRRGSYQNSYARFQPYQSYQPYQSDTFFQSGGFFQPGGSYQPGGPAEPLQLAIQHTGQSSLAGPSGGQSQQQKTLSAPALLNMNQNSGWSGPPVLRGRGGSRGRGMPRGVIDKSGSTCFHCQGVGHWAGDPECPLGLQEPLPPGTFPVQTGLGQQGRPGAHGQ